MHVCFVGATKPPIFFYFYTKSQIYWYNSLVVSLFNQPKKATKAAIVDWAKKEGFYAASTGILDNISTLQ